MSVRMRQIWRLLSALAEVIAKGSTSLLDQDTPYPLFAAARIVPLEDEFADLFDSGRKFISRLVCATSTDLREPKPGTYREVEQRGRALRRTKAMPSAVIRAVAGALGCEPSERLKIDLRFHRRKVTHLGEDCGFSYECARVFWATPVDLDAQWHALRSALLALRAEMGGDL